MSRAKIEEQPEVNVKVIVRCRPFSEHEKKDFTQYQIVTARNATRELTVSQTIPGRKIESYSKTYTFDGVCNQTTAQQDLFNIYITPIVEEVLQGFNCTIFAYGQTGTGKTYTMEGDLHDQLQRAQQDCESMCGTDCDSTSYKNTLMLTEEAGIIPRSVKYIFEKLEAQVPEYSVRVSYLEIYNEELNDLLNDGEKQCLRIFEDANSKKALAVDRLEEIAVNSPQDILHILSFAVKKRRTAETLLNRQSSRSHCIFSVTIHMKETNLDGEDVIKIGKLNLVDLAGSENIQKSGANNVKNRAKEAGMINQSLLTLGRVINALVEHSSYIPYRDSKLTRLLQDSLGGRTKTCIVATISPSSLCLEETLSTLDYAFRAKNIRNRPEINQRMTKRVMIRELNKELERLRSELVANREKNGVYIPLEKFMEMESKDTNQQNALTTANAEIATLKEELNILKSSFDDLKEELQQKQQLQLSYDAEQHKLKSMINKMEKDLKKERQQRLFYENNSNQLYENNSELEKRLKESAAEIKNTCHQLSSLTSLTDNMMQDIRKLFDDSQTSVAEKIQSDLNSSFMKWFSYFDKYQDSYSKDFDNFHEQIKKRLFVLENLSKDFIKNVQNRYSVTQNNVIEYVDNFSNFYKSNAESIKNDIETTLMSELLNVQNSLQQTKSLQKKNQAIIDSDLSDLKSLYLGQENELTEFSKSLHTTLKDISFNTISNTKKLIQESAVENDVDTILNDTKAFQSSVLESIKSFVLNVENCISNHNENINKQCNDLKVKQSCASASLSKHVENIETFVIKNVSSKVDSFLDKSVTSYNKKAMSIHDKLENKLKSSLEVLNEQSCLEKDISKIKDFLQEQLPNKLQSMGLSPCNSYLSSTEASSKDKSEDNKENIKSIMMDNSIDNFCQEYKLLISATKSDCEEIIDKICGLHNQNMNELDSLNRKQLEAKKLSKAHCTELSELSHKLNSCDVDLKCSYTEDILKTQVNTIVDILSKAKDYNCKEPNVLAESEQSSQTIDDYLLLEEARTPIFCKPFEIPELYGKSTQTDSLKKSSELKTAGNVSIKVTRESIDTPIPNYDLRMISNKQSKLSECSQVSSETIVPSLNQKRNSLLSVRDDDDPKLGSALSPSVIRKSSSLSQYIPAPEKTSFPVGTMKNECAASSSQPVEVSNGKFGRSNSTLSSPIKIQSSRKKLSSPTPSNFLSEYRNRYKTPSNEFSSSSSSLFESKPKSRLFDIQSSSTSLIGRYNKKNSVPKKSFETNINSKKKEMVSNFQESTKITQLNTRKKYSDNH